MPQAITLLTDFGLQDTYVGVVKGVIKTISPDADIIDLTHQVPPQDIFAGAFLLKTVYRYFPPGTIHLVIVDPGVGSARLPIAAHIGDFYFVCPDNGLLSYVLSDNIADSAVILDDSDYHLSELSRTFHGRDVFAPVAAHLSLGVSLDDLGTQIESLTTFTLPEPYMSDGTVICHVIYADAYGNLFLDLTENMAFTIELSGFVVEIFDRIISGPMNSYSHVSEGMPLALFGSSGHLEISIRGGHAQQQFGLRVGDAVLLHRTKK